MKALLLAAVVSAAPQAPQEAQALPGTQPTPGTTAVPETGTLPITLEQARTEGRKNTQALLSLLDLERSEQDVRASRAPLLPQLNFTTNVGRSYIGRQRVFTTVPDPATGGFVQQAVETPSTTTGNYNISFNLSQVIYDRARWKALEQSGAIAEATRGQTVEQEDASELEAVNRFYNLYRSQASLRVLEATVQRSQEQVERARALFQAGRVGRGEELSALVNLGNDRISLVQGRAQLVQNQTQLAIWLARPGTQPLLAQEPATLTEAPAPAPSTEQAIAEARQRRPLIQALQQQVRAAELAQSVASAGYIPKFSGQASYARSGPAAGPVFTEPRLQNTLTGALYLQWNLFDGFATSSQVAKAEASVRTAQLNLEQAERELDATVRSSIETLQTRIEAARLSAENREAAQQSLTLAEERFKAGAGSTLEVRDAQLKLTQAELTLLGNRVDVEIARFALMRAMGTLSPGETK
jgi:outer membrane protein TolC